MRRKSRAKNVEADWDGESLACSRCGVRTDWGNGIQIDLKDREFRRRYCWDCEAEWCKEMEEKWEKEEKEREEIPKEPAPAKTPEKPPEVAVEEPVEGQRELFA